MKRVGLIVLVIVVLLGSGLWFARSRRTTTSLTIETHAVERQDFAKTVSSSGKTSAAKSVELKFQTSGKLAWVGVKEGDTVTAYQAIAGMDVREVRKNLEKALRDYSSERNDFEETWRVTYDGKAPYQAFSDTVKRILEKNQWDLEKAVLDVELKHLAVEYATLVTPIAGLVTHIDAPIAGVNITPATAVFAISDPNSLIFEANVDEIDVGALALAQSATVVLDAFPDTVFRGKVSYISYASQTSSGGATVFPVKVAFDEPQSLRIGLNGDITIDVERQPSVLTIPIEAVRESKGKKYVYRKTGKTYEKVEIIVGSQNENTIIVASGLTDGDSVVTKGFANISE